MWCIGTLAVSAHIVFNSVLFFRWGCYISMCVCHHFFSSWWRSFLNKKNYCVFFFVAVLRLCEVIFTAKTHAMPYLVWKIAVFRRFYLKKFLRHENKKRKHKTKWFFWPKTTEIVEFEQIEDKTNFKFVMFSSRDAKDFRFFFLERTHDDLVETKNKAEAFKRKHIRKFVCKNTNKSIRSDWRNFLHSSLHMYTLSMRAEHSKRIICVVSWFAVALYDVVIFSLYLFLFLFFGKRHFAMRKE